MMNASDPTRPPPAEVERLSQLAARFHAAWKTHRDDPQAVDLAAFLPPGGDSLRVLALYELVPLDLAARWKAGVPLSLEDYVGRFPELGPLDAVPSRLIAEEHRIRALYGVVSPDSVLRGRFPVQFDAVKRLISAESVSPSAPTLPPPADRRPTESHAMLLSPGQIIGDHYQLNKLIGRGGFGEVWHATDLRGSIDKAIKVLTRSADSEEAQKELESLNIIKKINHPCLLRTESYFVEKERLLIVLELADVTLRDVLKQCQAKDKTGIPSDILLTYMRHAAEGLDFLHKQGILHRDVKPENILLVGDYAKMADFGLAKEAHNKQSTKADFAGTVVYSAPETWDGRVTTRSDQYSLAATYFELRTGRILFGGKTFQEVFSKHMEGHSDLSPLPELEQNVLRIALSKTPEQRYPTCTIFVRELVDAVLASGSKVVESKPKSTAGKDTDRVHGTIAPLPLASLGGSQAKAPSKPEKKWNVGPTTAPSRPKRSRRGLVAGVVALLVVGGVLATGYSAHASLDQAVEAKLQADDVSGAVAAVDESSVFTLPFRGGLREKIRQRARQIVERFGEDADPEDVDKTIRPIVEALRDDPIAADRLAKAYQQLIPILVQKEEFKAAFEKARALPEANGRAKLEGEIRRPLLAKAWELVKAGQPDPARKLADGLLEHDPNSAEAREVGEFVDAAAESDKQFQLGNFREAMSRLPNAEKAAQLIADRKAAIKNAWLESARRMKDEDAAINEVSSVARAFPEDAVIQKEYLTRKNDLSQRLMTRVADALAAKDTATVDALIDRAEAMGVKKNSIQAARLLKTITSLEGQKSTPAIRENIASQLGLVQLEPLPPEPLLERIAESLARLSNKDEALAVEVKPNLGRLRQKLPKWTPSAEYLKLFPPSLTPERILLNDAVGLLKKDPLKGRDLLLAFNLGTIADTDARRDGRTALVALVQDGAFDRAQLRSLDPVAAESPDVKSAIAIAMTTKLQGAIGEWPDSEAAWKERLADCGRASPKDLVVQALKAEANLEIGGKVKEQLPPGGDEPYLNYVRARIWGASGEIARAATAAMTVPPANLVSERKLHAAAMLQQGALALTPIRGGRRQLFTTVADADRAFAWQTRALELLHRAIDEPKVLTAPLALNYALAAACKSDPDLALNKSAGDLFLKDVPKNDLDAGLLALSNPAAFVKLARAGLAEADIAAMIDLGDAQQKASPENPSLKQRQARLWFLRGRAREPVDGNPAGVREADARAFDLEPGNVEYTIALGRDDAVLALADANGKAEPAAKIAALREGLKASAAAEATNAIASEMWPELLRARAEISVQIARHSDRANAIAAFDSALATLKKAPQPLAEDLDFILGQAHEGLAYQCNEDAEKNYTAAARAYRDAAARKPTYAFTHGRCLVRWATDDLLKVPTVKRKELLDAAIGEFDRVLKVKDFDLPAQANYFAGAAMWSKYDPSFTVPKAKDALVRSLTASAGDPDREGYLAGASLKMLVAMTKNQLKTSPEMSANWLLDAEKAVVTLEKSKVVADDFGVAVRDYRDLLADASVLAARQYLNPPTNDPKKLFTPNYVKYRSHIDRAIELKHSRRHAEYAVDRAIEFKKNQTALGLNPAELNAVRQTAIDAIDVASPLQREPLKKRLADGWK